MSDNSAFGFGKFVPGFDFLQSLAKTAHQPQASGSAIPGLSSWVAPTLSVEELDKRIQELKTVLFWLEQNGTALKATIQALEVQKMTLSTLQNMNVNMADLARAFTAKAPESAASDTTDSPVAEPVAKPSAPAEAAAQTADPDAPPNAPAQAVDPMAWWGSLTQQFQNIASAAMKDVAADALKGQATTAKAPAAPRKSSTKSTSRSTAPRATAKKASAKSPSARKSVSKSDDKR